MARLKYIPSASPLVSPFDHVEILIDGESVQAISSISGSTDIERGNFFVHPGKHTIAMRTGSVETEPVHFEAIADELWEVRFVGKTMKGTDSLNLTLLFILCMLLLVAGLNIQPPYSYACLTLGGAILVAAMLRSANGFTVHVTQAKEL